MYTFLVYNSWLSTNFLYTNLDCVKTYCTQLQGGGKVTPNYHWNCKALQYTKNKQKLWALSVFKSCKQPRKCRWVMSLAPILSACCPAVTRSIIRHSTRTVLQKDSAAPEQLCRHIVLNKTKATSCVEAAVEACCLLGPIVLEEEVPRKTPGSARKMTGSSQEAWPANRPLSQHHL